MPLDQEIKLSAKCGTGLFLVKIGEEWIVFGIEYAPCVQAVGQDAGQCGFADANRTFDRN
jgi:hypothetical protein